MAHRARHRRLNTLDSPAPGKPAARSRPVSAAPPTSDEEQDLLGQASARQGPSDTRCPSCGGTTHALKGATVPAVGDTSHRGLVRGSSPLLARRRCGGGSLSFCRPGGATEPRGQGRESLRLANPAREAGLGRRHRSPTRSRRSPAKHGRRSRDRTVELVPVRCRRRCRTKAHPGERPSTSGSGDHVDGAASTKAPRVRPSTTPSSRSHPVSLTGVAAAAQSTMCLPVHATLNLQSSRRLDRR
jgi:hypothetical protein